MIIDIKDNDIEMEVITCDPHEVQIHETNELFLDLTNSLKASMEKIKIGLFPDLTPMKEAINFTPNETGMDNQIAPLNRDWRFYSEKKELLENPEQAPTMIQQIQVAIHQHYYYESKSNEKSKRGRPEVIKDTSSVALK